MERKTVHYLVAGAVQGVGYRAFVQRGARGLGLDGFVRNLADGRVEVLACGSANQLRELEISLRQGPRYSRVDAVTATDWPDAEPANEFAIQKDGEKPCVRLP